MINFSNLDVKSLTTDEMNSLIGLKFVDNNSDGDHLISRDRLPENSRVIPKGYLVTMDYQEDRLNLHLNEEGIVTKVKKG